MKSFETFLAESARYGGGVNVVFEAGMYSLTSDVQRIIEALQSAGIRFEVVGGVAVNAHIFQEHRSRSFVTRDIDILLSRDDIEKAAHAAESLGYMAKKMMGEYAFVRPNQQLAEAVHLLFVGEKSKSTQPVPHPELHPEEKDFLGIAVPVAPIQDLVQMKLNSFRPKDMVHLEILDEAGLITPTIEAALHAELQRRLTHARVQFAENKPDIEP